MTGTLKCLRCHADMETGFVADRWEYGFTEQRWSPGKPTKGWAGIKMKKKPLIPVRTLRCPKCGYLESYALSEGVS